MVSESVAKNSVINDDTDAISSDTTLFGGVVQSIETITIGGTFGGAECEFFRNGFSGGDGTSVGGGVNTGIVDKHTVSWGGNNF